MKPVPAADTSMAPSDCGVRSNQAVLPNGVPLQTVFSVVPPPSGCPSRDGLKMSGCVVASVRSTADRNSILSTGSDAR